MTIELIGPDSVRIGARTVRMRLQATPMKDGTTHLVEATSDPSRKFQEKLNPSDLSGVKAESIPKGFQLLISDPETRIAGLDYLAIDNIRHGRRMLISLSYFFDNWSRRTSLLDFAETFRRLIEQELHACRDVRIAKGQYDVSLWIALSLDPGGDCYETSTKTEDVLGSLYKQALAKGDKQFETATSTPDAGFRW